MRILWRVGIIPLLALLLVQGMWGQEVGRVHPGNVHAPLRDVVVWSGDTVVACGLNSAILLSTDRGASWTNIDAPLSEFSVYQITRAPHAIYLLAIPTSGDRQDVAPPPGYASILLRYVPSSGEIRRIDYPRLAGIDTVEVPDEAMMRIGADADGLYLFCTMVSGKHQFVRSTDEGETWEDVMLPDSLRNITTGRFVGGSDGRIALLTSVPDGQTRKIIMLFPGGAGGEWRTVGDRLPPFDHTQAPLLWDGDAVLLQDDLNTLHASDDGGLTWHLVSIPPFGSVSTFAGRMTSRLFAFTEAGEIFASADRGYSWSQVATLYRSQMRDPFRFVAKTLSTGEVMVADNVGNIYRTADGGLSWDSPRNQSLAASDAWNSGMSGVETGMIRALELQTGEQRMYGTTNGCRELFAMQRPVEIGYVRPVFCADDFWYGQRSEAVHGDTLMYISSDQGHTWRILLAESDCAECLPVQTDIRSTSKDILLFPTTAGLRLSTDGGQSWPLVYPVKWEQSHRPINLVVDAGRASVWVLPDALDPWHIVQGRTDTAAWDTLYTMPPEQRDGLYGIADLFIAEDGEIYAFAYPNSMTHVIVLRSEDDGTSWTSTQVRIEPLHRFEVLQEISVLPNRSVIAYLMRSDPEGMTLHRWMLSTDGLENWTPLFERHVDNRLGSPSAGLIPAGSSSVYFLCGTEIFHATTPGVNWTDVTPALPSSLRIAAVWPQPLTTDGMLHARIECDTPGHARLELHDLLGRRRAIPFDGRIDGSRDVQFAMSHLEAGVYLLRLISGGESVGRVVVKR